MKVIVGLNNVSSMDIYCKVGKFDMVKIQIIVSPKEMVILKFWSDYDNFDAHEVITIEQAAEFGIIIEKE
jgi:hypothetical protein